MTWLPRLTICFLLITVGCADVAQDLERLQTCFFEWYTCKIPEFATDVGIQTFNSRLEELSLKEYSRRNSEFLIFLRQLKNIDKEKLNQKQQIDYEIFKYALETYTDGYKWVNYGPLNPLTDSDSIRGPDLLSKMPTSTKNDFKNIIRRIRKIPVQVDEMIRLMETAIKKNHTLHKITVEDVSKTIENVLLNDKTNSEYNKQFKDKLDKSNLTRVQRNRFTRMSRLTAMKAVYAYRKLRHFLVTKYMKYTRKYEGLWSLENGRDYYKDVLKWHLTADISPEKVHQLGLDEIERISEKMKKIIKKLGYSKTIREFLKMLRNKPRFHLNSSEALLQRYKDIVYKRAYPKLDGLFENIPNMPLKVEAMKYGGAGAEYTPGSEDGTKPGVFAAGVKNPKETTTTDMPAITVHEGVPGHHLQTSYSLSANLPSFRKNIDFWDFCDIPMKLPIYTAYLEGWGLYAEYLGEEMGVYKDDYEMMGRYNLEIFRGCRLVVDTGIHYFGWNQSRAVDYMLNYTSFSRDFLTAQINYYISTPGVACAYKIGEIKFKELRKKAEQAMGSCYDVRKFHSLILTNGAVPLAILEKMVDNWIDSCKTN